MSEPLYSRPYRPSQCCEGCVFGRAEHAVWCPSNEVVQFIEGRIRAGIQETQMYFEQERAQLAQAQQQARILCGTESPDPDHRIRASIHDQRRRMFETAVRQHDLRKR